MAPQAAASPQQNSENAEVARQAKAVGDLVARIAAKAEGERTPAERQIFRAARLDAERTELQKRIDANRKYLRLMDENDELSDAEGTVVDIIYPEKEKGVSRDKDDVATTRKAKEAARKAIAAAA